MKMVPYNNWEAVTYTNGETGVRVGAKWWRIPSRDAAAASMVVFRHQKKVIALTYSEFRQEWTLLVWRFVEGVKEASRESAAYPEIELTYRDDELWCRLGDDRYSYDSPTRLAAVVERMYSHLSPMCSAS